MLLLVLFVSAYGGDMQTGVVAPTPTPTLPSAPTTDTGQSNTSTVYGEMPIGLLEVATDIALELIESLLSL